MIFFLWQTFFDFYEIRINTYPKIYHQTLFFCGHGLILFGMLKVWAASKLVPLDLRGIMFLLQYVIVYIPAQVLAQVLVLLERISINSFSSVVCLPCIFLFVLHCVCLIWPISLIYYAL